MRAFQVRQQAADERLSDVFDVLQIHIPAHTDLKRLFFGDCLHGQGGIGRKPAVAAHAIYCPGPKADAGNTARQIESARIPLVGLLEHTVMRGRLQRLVLGQLAASVKLLRPPHGRRAGIHDAHGPPGVPGGGEHIQGSDDVDHAALDRIRVAERH